MSKNLNNLKKSPAYSGMILFVIALVIYLVVQLISSPSDFFTTRTYSNFIALFKNYTPIIIITMAQAYLMLLGIIDISIGIQMSFANVLAVTLPSMLGIPVALAWIMAVLATVLLSTINGLIVSYLRIPPLLAGFAMIYVVKGINLIISPKPGGKVPSITNKVYSTVLLKLVPVSFLIIVLCYLMWKYFSKTKLCKKVYAIGGNERNAYATGINSQAVKVKIYVITGLLTGIAGLCYTAAYNTGNPITGEIYGIQSISACILGGISLAGGWGTMSCAFYGIGFQLLIQTSVPKVFALISKATGQSFNTYWHNLLSDTIILLGLILTIFFVSSNKENFVKGAKKQLKGGSNDGK